MLLFQEDHLRTQQCLFLILHPGIGAAASFFFFFFFSILELGWIDFIHVDDFTWDLTQRTTRSLQGQLFLSSALLFEEVTLRTQNTAGLIPGEDCALGLRVDSRTVFIKHHVLKPTYGEPCAIFLTEVHEAASACALKYLYMNWGCWILSIGELTKMSPVQKQSHDESKKIIPFPSLPRSAKLNY